MSGKKVRSGLWIDPRTKIVLLLLCVLAAAMAPSLFYEILLVCLVAVFWHFIQKPGKRFREYHERVAI